MSQMQPRFSTDLWPSLVPFEVERVHALAVYCSDGRFGEQCDDYLQRRLGLPFYDRLAVPGGAALLAADREQTQLFPHLHFLVEAHELTKLVLIAHDGCAYYSQLLGLGPIDMRERQEADLKAVSDLVSAKHPHLDIHTSFAHVEGDRVTFEQLRF